LRFAICSASSRTLQISVNDTPAGTLDNLNFNGDATITRHNIQGIWFEREFSFDARMMKQGTNTITLTMPAGPLNNGIIYDCVRLELDDSRLATASANRAIAFALSPPLPVLRERAGVRAVRIFPRKSDRPASTKG
jgi:polysaccharide lyase family 4-like protein